METYSPSCRRLGSCWLRTRAKTLRLLDYNPDYPGYSYDDVIHYAHDVPELEALMRQAMILHNQYRWDPVTCACVDVNELKDDDFVIALHPRNNEVLQFIRRAKEKSRGARGPFRDAGNSCSVSAFRTV